MNSTLSHSGSRWVSGGLSMPILAILYTRRRGGGRGGNSSHSIHKAKEVGSQSTRAPVLGIMGVSSRDAR